MSKPCALAPQVGGENSRLYLDLVSKKKENLNRYVANMIYSMYIVNDVESKMDAAVDSAGNKLYKKNRQGQFNAKDVIDFLGIRTELANIRDVDISIAEKNLGAIDSIGGNRVEFASSKEALDKVEEFNSTHTGLVATVTEYRRTDGSCAYTIFVKERNSKTLGLVADAQERLKAWDIYTQAFNATGIDITQMPAELNGVFSAFNTQLGQYLRDLAHTDFRYLRKRDALILFNLDKDSRQVQNVVRAFGSIDNAAEAMSALNSGSTTLNSGDVLRLKEAIDHARNLRGININALITQVNDATKQVKDKSDELKIKEEIHKLNKKYGIDKNGIESTTRKIEMLSEATAKIAITLKRQVDELLDEKNDTEEARRKQVILDKVLRELAANKYYSGVLDFIKEATVELGNIESIIEEILNTTGTEREQVFRKTTLLQHIRDIKNQYCDILEAIADKSLKMDESINQIDVNTMREQAKIAIELYNKEAHKISALTKDTMISLVSTVQGEAAPERGVIESMIDMASKDIGMLDHYLYSMSRASNTLLNTVGTIILDAQMERDAAMNEIMLEIRRANDKLQKAGYTSEFMYEGDRYIASNYAWGHYHSERNNKSQELYVRGIEPGTVTWNIEMEKWENEHTVEIVVDDTPGVERTERVPDERYRKSKTDDKFFQQGWAPEQIEYYDTMMKLKGRLGTLLPAYAQHQYWSPQIRRNFLDALGQGDVKKGIKNKAQNFYKVREDDTDYAFNGLINGENMLLSKSNYDDTAKQQIPVFFINEVEKGELLKDFSTGLTALAKSAINYAAMNNIVDACEFIRDYAEEQNAPDPLNKASVVENKFIQVTQKLIKAGKKSNVAEVLTEGIAFQIYGQKKDPTENKTASKIMDNIIAYTSFKGLATNAPGAMANAIMGELQMFIEAGAGEFYGATDFIWAHSKLFGAAGVGGEIMELLTNNMSHKATLMREVFDPMQENFTDKGAKRFHSSMFRQLVSHDCSFIGYSSGEYLIHYINMYAILHNTKVNYEGKKVSLYDVLEVSNKKDGNATLKIKDGVTDLHGNAITDLNGSFIQKIRGDIRYVNQTTHGSMNAEDKGMINRKMLGRAAINFRQWMVEHYSRRFRGRHFDGSLKQYREGYWVSFWKGLMNDDTKDYWNSGHRINATLMFMKDFATFMLRSSAQWKNLTDEQKANVKRVKTEMLMYVALIGLSAALGEPEEHKKEFWRRWWIYQTKRMILDTEASMPHPKNISNWITIMNSPMACVNTMNSFMYVLYGLYNGDITKELKSGPHKGENKYWRNIIKYCLPVAKDIERLQTMDDSDSLFKIFEASPSNH